jgi:hypothetical protein
MGVVRSGLVQAVKNLSTEQIISRAERAAYHDALKSLSGIDAGSSPKAWRRFWTRERKRLLSEHSQAVAPTTRPRRGR